MNYEGRQIEFRTRSFRLTANGDSTVRHHKKTSQSHFDGMLQFLKQLKVALEQFLNFLLRNVFKRLLGLFGAVARSRSPRV